MTPFIVALVLFALFVVCLINSCIAAFNAANRDPNEPSGWGTEE